MFEVLPTGALMEGNLPPERYDQKWHPGTPFIVFVIQFAELFVVIAYALRSEMQMKSLTETHRRLVASRVATRAQATTLLTWKQAVDGATVDSAPCAAGNLLLSLLLVYVHGPRYDGARAEMPLLASSSSSSSAGAGGRERGLARVHMCGSPPSGIARCGRSGRAVCNGAACD